MSKHKNRQNSHSNNQQVVPAACYLLLASCLFLAACAKPFASTPEPPATPTPPIAPYNAAVATAEARGDPREQGIALYERGNAQLDAGAYVAAIDDYDRAVALNLKNARAFNNRGLAYTALGKQDEALADYSAAIALDSHYTRAYENRVRIEEQRGDLRGLADDYGRLAELDPPNRADHLYGQGNALVGLRDSTGARRAFDAALAINPQQVDALYERALLSYAEGQLPTAIADLDAALQLSPNAANAHYARALAFTASGDASHALADFNATLAAQPRNADALLGRATAYAAAGDTAHARADLDRLDTLKLDQDLKAGTDTLRRQMGP